MEQWKSFPYKPASGEGQGELPFCPALLISPVSAVVADALLDSGATVCVLPHSVGITLGFQWDKARPSLPLGGNLARFEARSVILKVALPEFQPQLVEFSWSRSENVPVILGQRNFFQLFDGRFSGLTKQFNLRLSAPSDF